MRTNNRMAKDILEKNPKVCKSVVKEYQELEKSLEKLKANKPKRGARYTLSPPFGNILNLPYKQMQSKDQTG